MLGFGLEPTAGTGMGAWADGTCREIALYAAGWCGPGCPDGPTGWGNGRSPLTFQIAAATTSWALAHASPTSAVVAGGTYHLQMMGIDREEGDRIARVSSRVVQRVPARRSAAAA